MATKPVNADTSFYALLSSRQDDTLWTEWRAQRAQQIRELAEGPAKVSATVGTKKTKKIILANARGRVTDLFVSVEYSASVSLGCPQEAATIVHAKHLATQLALEGMLDWMDGMDETVINYLKERELAS